MQLRVAACQNLTFPSLQESAEKIVCWMAGYFEGRLDTATIDLTAATRAVALRAANDDRILRA